MSIKKTSIIAAFLIVAACHTETNHMPPEKMQQVLLDLQLAEVYGSMAGTDSLKHTGLRNNDSLIVYYHDVLAHHNITLQEFTQSLDWYRHHPDQLDTIYVRAMDKLGKKDGVNLR